MVRASEPEGLAAEAAAFKSAAHGLIVRTGFELQFLSVGVIERRAVLGHSLALLGQQYLLRPRRPISAIHKVKPTLILESL